MALGGLPATDVTWADGARERIERWEARRHEDWVGNPAAWEAEDREPFGWQNFTYRAPAQRTAATDRPVLTNLSYSYANRSCGSF